MRRTGKEGLYSRVVDKDLEQRRKELAMKEMRLQLLGFERVSDEQREENLLCLELYK